MTLFTNISVLVLLKFFIATKSMASLNILSMIKSIRLKTGRHVFFSLILVWSITGKESVAQDKSLTKIYFYHGGSLDIKIKQSLNQPIRISGYTLLETDLDSLTFSVLADQFVSVPFEKGRTYYFRTIGSGGSTAEPSFTTSTEQEFWLNVSAFSRGRYQYRHYLLDEQSGLKLLEEKR